MRYNIRGYKLTFHSTAMSIYITKRTVNIIKLISLVERAKKFPKYNTANDTPEKNRMKCNAFTFHPDDITWRKMKLGLEDLFSLQ